MDPSTSDALVTGSTTSTNFPTVNPLQPTSGGGTDAFVTKIGATPVAYFYLSPASATVAVGVPFDLYVFALDARFNFIPEYTGAIVFYSTDPRAITPVVYRFQPVDGGVASFPGGVTLFTPDVQELYVFDTTYTAGGYAAYDVR